MAIIRNEDGTATIVDESGRMDPITVPAEFVPGQKVRPKPSRTFAPSEPTGPLPAPPAPQELDFEAPVRPAPERAQFVQPPLPAPPTPKQFTEPGQEGLFGAPAAAPPSRLSTSGSAQYGGSAASVAAGAAPTGASAAPSEPAPMEAEAPEESGSVDPNQLAEPAKMVEEAPPPPAEGGEEEMGAAPEVRTPEVSKHMALGTVQQLEKWAPKRVYSPPSPAADVPKTWAIKKAQPVSPESKEAYIQSTNQRIVSTLNAADIDAASQAQQGLNLKLQAAEMRRRSAEIDKQVRDEEKIFQAKMAPIHQEIAALQKEASVNPSERYWDRKGAVGSIVAKIGIALAGGSAPLAGLNTNPVADMIKGEIDQEVEFQKAKLETGMAGISAKRGLLAEYRATMLSPEAAEAATRALLLSSAEAEIKAQAAMSSSEEVRARAVDAVAKIGEERALQLMKIEQAERGEMSVAGVHKPATAGGVSIVRPKGAPTTVLEENEKLGNLMKMKPEEVAYLRETGKLPAAAASGHAASYLARVKLEKAQDIMRRTVPIPDEFRNLAPNLPGELYATAPLQQGNMNSPVERLSALGAYKNNLIYIQKLIENPATLQTIPGSEVKAQLETIRPYQGALAKKGFIGEAMTIGELKALWDEVLIGQSTGILTIESNTKARLRESINQVDNIAKSQIKTLSLDPMHFNPAGKLMQPTSGAKPKP